MKIIKNIRRLRTQQTLARRIYKDCDRDFNAAKVSPVQFKIRNSAVPKSPTDLILEKKNGQITVLLNQSNGPGQYRFNRGRIAAHVYWFSQANDRVKRIVADITDGHKPSMAPYKFSSYAPEHALLPDPVFFRNHGYADFVKASENAPAWDDRSDKIVWRGSVNGVGLFSIDPNIADNPGVIQRLRMAVKCQENEIDFRFGIQSLQPSRDVLHHAGLIGEFVSPFDWADMKFAVDIDGYSNAWSNLMQRLKLGCCVLKVESPFGFRQWYYDRLVPWEHFVPISADLSDLSAQIEWVRSNPRECRRIARQGHELAKTLTFESERRFAIETIEARELG